jgi:hypothetical protein
MIKFFRKIRNQLLAENKVGKYLVYAIGEIILVVIGILIAVSINNWNEDLKERQIEQELLQSLKMEISSNIEHFKYRIQYHMDSRSMVIAILQQFGNPNRNMNLTILDSLVEHASAPGTLNPQISVIKSIISTGEIKYLKNEMVVQFVTMFEDKGKEIADDFNRLIGTWSSQLWPRENLYVRRLNRASANNKWIGIDLPRSGANSNYDSFFDDIVLENTYMLTLYEQTANIKDEEKLLNQMTDILDIINSELLSSN